MKHLLEEYGCYYKKHRSGFKNVLIISFVCFNFPPYCNFMRKAYVLLTCVILFLFTGLSVTAQPTGIDTIKKVRKPDTVKVGLYVTSIHNIDFKQKEYTTTFWLWLKYKRK